MSALDQSEQQRRSSSPRPHIPSPQPSSKPSSKTPDSLTNQVRVLRFDEAKQAALSLAEAFTDDKVSEYFTHTPDRDHWTTDQKWDLHVSILEYVVYAHIRNGLALTVGLNYGSVALWMPPGKNMDDWMTILQSGMWRLYYKLSREGRARWFEEFFPLLHETKVDVLGDRDLRSYYLTYIGTRPEARRQGLARKLIAHVTEMADVEQAPCYIENSHVGNAAFYGSMGFGVAKRIFLRRDKDPIELNIMVREPISP